MYIIIYDFGTSSVKTCLFNINPGIDGILFTDSGNRFG